MEPSLPVEASRWLGFAVEKDFPREFICACVFQKEICIYIYTYIYIPTYVHMYIYNIHMYIHTYTHVCMRVLTYVRLYVCMYVCIVKTIICPVSAMRRPETPPLLAFSHFWALYDNLSYGFTSINKKMLNSRNVNPHEPNLRLGGSSQCWPKVGQPEALLNELIGRLQP